MKANHNGELDLNLSIKVVSSGSKILKWKQITTRMRICICSMSCFQWFKDTKMKANHNKWWVCLDHPAVVSSGSKILKWKQITTKEHCRSLPKSCFQWFKDTKMKANHNADYNRYTQWEVVSSGSKILKWKQITTQRVEPSIYGSLFPVVQRY